MTIKAQVHLKAGENIGDAIRAIHDMGLTYDSQENVGDRTIVFCSKQMEATETTAMGNEFEGSDANPAIR